MKKTRLKRQSAKRKHEAFLYRSLAKFYLLRHPYCEMPSESGAPTCMRRAVQIHHMHGRTGTLLCDVSFWLAVCRECHDYIHQNGKEARKRGVLK